MEAAALHVEDEIFAHHGETNQANVARTHDEIRIAIERFRV
jgi:hypothetical protein